MKIYQVVKDDQAVSSHSTLPEAIREAVTTGNLKIQEIERPDNSRRYSMSKFAAPEDYLWYHKDLGEQDGDGTVLDTTDTKREWKRIRREWLSQFTLSVAEVPERGYRYWRWSGPTGEVVWTERRPWEEDFKGEPGFWPAS